MFAAGFTILTCDKTYTADKAKLRGYAGQIGVKLSQSKFKYVTIITGFVPFYSKHVKATIMFRKKILFLHPLAQSFKQACGKQAWQRLTNQISQFVGKKANGRISKRMFQENKTRQKKPGKNEHFRKKTNISYPPDTHTYVYVSVGKKYSFSRKIWHALFS